MAPSEFSIKLGASILSADLAILGEQVAEATAAGADYIHVDVMDGRFVPNITFGANVVAAVKSWTNIPIDVHLMIVEPEIHIQAFVTAGADILTVHVEACSHLHRVIQKIKSAGVKAGAAINPGTSISAIEDVLSDLDMVLIMSVNPGLSGQEFIPASLDKLHRIRRRLDVAEATADLAVDGGINEFTASASVAAGARALVAGSAIFNNKESAEEAIRRLLGSL
jgi:ribulose-phosphate 3-epimerase